VQNAFDAEALTAAPSMEDKKVRRSAFPMVVPKPAQRAAQKFAVLVGQGFGFDCETLGFENLSKDVFLLIRLARCTLRTGGDSVAG